MRKKLLYLCCLFMLLMQSTIAQQKQRSADWYLMPGITLLNGDHIVSQSIQLSGGIQYKQLYAGLSAGIDYYKIRSVPLLAELRYGLDSRFTPFAFIHSGYNLAWALEHQHAIPSGPFSSNGSVFNNGLYAGGGIGCYVYKKGRDGILLSLGYNVKKLTELYDEIVWTGTGNSKSERELNYTLKRIAVTLSFRF